MDFDDQKQLCQVHPVLISCDMIDNLHVDLSVSADAERETRVIVSSSLYWVVCPPFCESAASERYTAGMALSVEDHLVCEAFTSSSFSS